MSDRAKRTVRQRGGEGMSGLSETVGSWRLAVRLARRTAVRSKARTALIVLMLALPVYAGTVLAMSYSATYVSADTETSWRMGRSDVQLSGYATDKIVAMLPAGATSVPITHGRTPLGVADRYEVRQYVAVDVDAPLTRGMFQPRSGRAPRGPGEVAVSTRLAEMDQVNVGDRVLVGLPPTTRTVVGIIDPAWELSLPVVVSPAEHRLSADLPSALVGLPPGVGWTPPPLTEELMKCVDEPSGGRSCNGYSYAARELPNPAELAARKAALMLVVGFAGTQVALLTGAAFAIGARRQRRELAMIGAVGASRRHLARLVLAHGLVLGVVAGVGGVALGALTYWVNRDLVERIANHPLDASSVPVWWLTGIALFAVAVGLLSALGPARSAARRSLRGELAGRESTTWGSNLRWLAGGMLVAGSGLAGAVYAAGATGSITVVAACTVAILLGVAAFSPVLVAGVGRFANRLPLALRLTARHAARHRLRTAASVAAVCAAVAGSMALTFYGAAAEAEQNWYRQPDARLGQVVIPADAAERLTPEQVRAVEAALPTRASLPVTTLTEPARVFHVEHPSGPAVRPAETVAVADTEADQRALISAVIGAEPPPAALSALADGGAVTFYPDLMQDGRLHLRNDLSLAAVLVPAPEYYGKLPGAVISKNTATRHGLVTRGGGILVDTTRMPTAAEVATANWRALAAQLRAEPSALPAELVVGAKHERRGRDYGPMFLIMAAVSGAVTLAAVAVAVGLATSEMRDDLSTLTAAGAAPRLRRRIAAAQAGLIVGIGVLLGLLGGIAPAAGMVAFRADLDWRVPWLPLLLTVIVVPVLAVAGTALFTRPRLVLVRRLN
jgi:putative ABC transport system permease protein